MDEAYTNLQQSKSQLDQLKALIDSGYATEEQIQTYEAGMVQYQEGLKSYETNLASLNATIIATQKQLDKTKSELDTFESGIKEYYEGLNAYESGLEDLKASKNEYEDGLAKYEAGMAEYEEGIADYKKETEDAQAEIDEGWEELEELEEPSVFVMDRNYNTGYSTYQNDASIVNKIATVLPIFFFLIAALVCSTTMTRMIDDDRTDIGTLRALGYQKGAIYFKYICYSGSAAIIGCIIGYLGLGYLFPQVIWIAYKMLYKIPGTAVIYSAWLFVLCLILSLLCSVGVTILNLRHVLKEMPAELIRPVAPPAGKRILLEYIGFIWKRLKFLHKVTLRNIFRFKKRMIMMILGIAGCTGLIVTGFGIHDSVSDICDYQYDDIMQYDLSVQTSDEVDAELLDKIESACGDSFSQMVSAVQKSVDITGEDATKSVYVIASDDTNLKDFISLSRNGKQVSIPTEENTAIITEKMCKLAGIKIGDEVSVSVSDTERVKVKIVGVVDNYVYNYLYMTADNYEKVFGAYEPQMVYIKLDETKEDAQIGASISKLHGVASVTVIETFRAMIAKMMKSLNYVVALVIISAAALAFVVLFNLGNINISERQREIATIKVLGFHQNETGAYVFRENLILSLIGIVFGLPLGVVFHRFVMAQIQVEMVSFKYVIKPVSYLIAVILVLIFTIVTDLILRRKIKAIDMAESLKSVE